MNKSMWDYVQMNNVSAMRKETAIAAGFQSLKEAKEAKKTATEKREQRAALKRVTVRNLNGKRDFYLTEIVGEKIYNMMGVSPANYDRNVTVTDRFDVSYWAEIDWNGYAKSCKYAMKRHHYYIEVPKTGCHYATLDNILTVWTRSRTIGQITVAECSMIFRGKGGCEVTCKRGWFAAQNLVNNAYADVAAHGETMREALEALLKKQKTLARKAAREARLRNLTPDTVLNMRDYRDLTGACEMGCKAFCDREGLPYTVKMTVRDLMEILLPSDYGYSKIVNLLNN